MSERRIEETDSTETARTARTAGLAASVGRSGADAGRTSDPIDPDTGGPETAARRPRPASRPDSARPARHRPVHLRLRWVLLVALGGMIGTGVREALSLTFPAPPYGFPLTVFGINVVGAFVLGWLLESLARRGPDEGGRRAARLGIGTGVLGGFTTYSALAVDTAQLAGTATGVGLLYIAGSVLVGTMTAWTGIATAAATAHRSASRRTAGRGTVDRSGSGSKGAAS
ncbi:CrcB family protein [Tersicoccus sp. MR15.9]|uniref:fluoride efflux transporter FluC n=1 Tax=Tersicoccus mangrovi TaxID=3121635 RepID=UPI002FE5534C